MRLIRQALLSFLIAASTCAGAAAQEQQTLTFPETRRLGATALLRGYPAHALEIAEALLRVDPQDVVALSLASRANRALGNYDEARSYARRAWDAAETDKERYHAATAMAQALSSDDKRTRAQFWLRRAAQHAPTPQARAAARRDYAYVRGRNPWRTSLTLGVTPSSNINNGAATDRIEIGGLSFQLSGDAQALSGTEMELGVSTEYRIRSGRRTILSFGGSLEARRYRLSGEAKDQAPDADADDYAYSSAELTFGLTRAPRPRRRDAGGPAFGLFSLTLGIGKSWYGGEELLTYTRARASQSFALNRRSSGWLAFSGEWQDRIDNAERSLSSHQVELGLSHRFDAGRLTLVIAAKDVSSDSALVAHTARRLSASYRLAEPVLTARATLSAGYEFRDYESGLFTADREDDRYSLGASFLFTEAEYYGFAPEVGVTWEQTDSSEALSSTETFGISFGLKSVF